MRGYEHELPMYQSDVHRQHQLVPQAALLGQGITGGPTPPEDDLRSSDPQ
ncbi:hypothetical protein Slin15195_G044980 [Septoria linicola]|uniref:Uncharacterized protein n=1 Tax=Septoria linicola TaxID=215465 RepID=A0A9Q9EIK2_9PEZI|nr:hypothetical protein Slin14017_G048500 [Septoria linicola]USW51179.1 hypothetical protein Slin15195_G044980 [Septoria linicola]